MNYLGLFFRIICTFVLCNVVIQGVIVVDTHVTQGRSVPQSINWIISSHLFPCNYTYIQQSYFMFWLWNRSLSEVRYTHILCALDDADQSSCIWCIIIISSIDVNWSMVPAFNVHMCIMECNKTIDQSIAYKLCTYFIFLLLECVLFIFDHYIYL